MDNTIPDEFVVEFDTITYQNGEHDRITLREPTAGEIHKASKEVGMMSTIVLVCLVSGTPRPVIEKLPIRKLREAAEYLEGFMPVDRETGAS